MLRIRFATEKDQIQGNWVLLKNTVSRRLRGDIFEIADEDRKLLDDHQLNYTILPVDPNELMRFEFLLPTKYNDGIKIDPEKFNQTSRELGDRMRGEL